MVAMIIIMTMIIVVRMPIIVRAPIMVVMPVVVVPIMPVSFGAGGRSERRREGDEREG
jgi:hypothetical protein